MFDPYGQWLGLPKSARPPTHYQLLGIAPTETDPEAIKEAALRQTSRIRVYQVGTHAEICTRVLNEIAQARTVLLNAKTRQEYDARLALPTTEPTAVAPPSADAPASLPPVVVAEPLPAPSAAFTRNQRAAAVTRRPGESHAGQWLGALAYCLLLAAGGAGSYWMTAHGLPVVPPAHVSPVKAAPAAKPKGPVYPAPVRGGKAP